MAPQDKKLNYGTHGETEVLLNDNPSSPRMSRPLSGMVKTQSATFSEDLINFSEGTVPQSIVVALTIGKYEQSQQWQIEAALYSSISSFVIVLYEGQGNSRKKSFMILLTKYCTYEIYSVTYSIVISLTITLCLLYQHTNIPIFQHTYLPIS